ncbi:n-alkane-inducible cytochrome P450 [Aspergillus steynii IBT 23096]|uniref:N-alkane-inducible cytochrome P450 n=1 Tax=Aspergillus steynii IBT 23096 TaxID=1392250 RepID=A0A2I2GRN3_9EURO|nr:n-alkane-inducible cytochrome P450 [Aspergillus steynii IBT 23096]PLB55538.1 n-alkane-inducible cytochrome P450 [Aspergillus steynii IBT 23096]
MWLYFVLVAILVIATRHIAHRIKRWKTTRHYALKYGTKDPVILAQIALPEGGNYDKEIMRAFKEHRGLELIQKRHIAGGYTFQTHTIGGRIINTSEPENIKTIQASRFEDYSLGFRQVALGPLLGKGVFTNDGKDWEHSRALVRPNMSKALYTDFNNLERHVQEMISHMPKDGIDVSSEFLFGESVRAFEAAEGSDEAKFGAAFDYASGETVRRLHYEPYLFLYFNRDFTKACKTVHRFVDKVIAKAATRRVEGKANQYIFLDSLMKSVTDPQRLRSETLNVMQAGRDTTASLLATVFYLLARHPEVWTKLDAEIGELNGKPPTYEELKKLTYLRYVMNETLQVHPVAPINSRVAVRDTILPVGGGPDHKSPIFIPKGQKVSFPTYVLHRRSDIYGPDAHEFRPDRWGEPTFRPGWAYIPFNGGPRICLGQQYALTEAVYTIVRLVQTFKAVEQRDFTRYKESVRVSASIFGGVQIGMIPRA